MSDVWAYIAHKDGYWAGVCCPGKETADFLAEFVADGFAISTVFSREEYETLLDSMQDWHKSPEWLAKQKPKAPDQAELAL